MALGIWRSGLHVAQDAGTVRLEYYICTGARLRLMLEDRQGRRSGQVTTHRIHNKVRRRPSDVFCPRGSVRQMRLEDGRR